MSDEKNIYEYLYYKLYNSITDAINILEKVQNETFQAFIDSQPSPKNFQKHISSVKDPSSKRYFFD